MGFLKAIAELIGQILAALVPNFIKEARKSRKVENVGWDDELAKDMDNEIDAANEDDEHPPGSPFSGQ